MPPEPFPGSGASREGGSGERGSRPALPPVSVSEIGVFRLGEGLESVLALDDGANGLLDEIE